MLRLVLASVIALLTAWSMETFAQTPPNVKVNSVTTNLQNEEQIWISPFNANIVVANWRDWRLGFRRIGVGYSTDGGTTWTDDLFPDVPYDRQSDPCMVGDRFGNFYANHLNYDNFDQNNTSLIVVMKSTDNGVTWSAPVETFPANINTFEDKQFTAVDRTGGAHDGNYYVSWTRFPNPTRILCVRSTDGAATFEDTVKLSKPNFEPSCGDEIDAGQFSIPIVDSDGDLHVFWQGYKVGFGCAIQYCIRHVMSTDGGASFSPDTVAFLSNYGYYNVDGGVDTYGMPNGDCDITGGPYDNTIYISQSQFAPGFFDRTNVIVRKSTDKGVTWSAPQVVNDDDPTAQIDQFHSWLYVNEDGVVLLIFYDQRDDPVGHTLFNAYFSASFDGGETYVTNMRISDVSINPAFAAPDKANQPDDVREADGTMYAYRQPDRSPLAGLFAEYIGIAAKRDTISTIWTDTRNGNQDAYSARFIMPFQQPRLYLPADGDTNIYTAPHFRWSTCWHEFNDSYRIEVSKQSNFATIDFAIDSVSDNDITFANVLDSAKYYWRVKAFRNAGTDSTGYSETFTFGRTLPATYLCGDADGNDIVTISDAVYLINYIFSGGPAPSPLLSADADCNGIVTISDAVYLINYIFAGGPAPCSAC
ncbi:MAG: dockerin type I domain-containing protein [Candidatus Zixiibacteriota bacterium]